MLIESKDKKEIQVYLKSLGYEIDRVLLRFERGEFGMPADFKEQERTPIIQNYQKKISQRLEEILVEYDEIQLRPREEV